MVNSLGVAYGLVLGILFAWMLVSGVISYFLIHASLQRELKWWKGKYGSYAVQNCSRGEARDGTGDTGIREKNKRSQDKV
jgi:hypothetical protein